MGEMYINYEREPEITISNNIRITKEQLINILNNVRIKHKQTTLVFNLNLDML